MIADEAAGQLDYRVVKEEQREAIEAILVDAMCLLYYQQVTGKA